MLENSGNYKTNNVHLIFQFDNSYSRLPEDFFAKVIPAKPVKPELIKWNTDLAEALGLKMEFFSDEDIAHFFSGHKLAPGSTPIALTYAGHQFGYFVPRLGDGRAVLLGEVLNPAGQRFDIQLKGAGRTPFSRSGDGKAPLGPVLREYLVSEGLHYLGLPTTRALAAVKTGDKVVREKIFPGAILTRVASSHIRIGTFEYFAAKNDLENLKILANYSIERHYPAIQKNSEGYLEFFRKVAQAQVELVASWIALGFIHGVLNTDNVSIAGETIDYGPCAFMDQFRFNQVFSSIDQFGRYSYSNQAQITLWNLSQFGNCLLPLIHQNSKKAQPLLENELASIQVLLEEQIMQKMKNKLGIFNEQPEDPELIKEWLDYLQNEQLDYTLSFRHLSNLVQPEQSLNFFPETQIFLDFYQAWQKRVQSQNLETQEIQQQMNKLNPAIIPRNHQIQNVIQAGLKGDFSLFHKMNQALKTPYTEQEQYRNFQEAPRPEQVVSATFCGT